MEAGTANLVRKTPPGNGYGMADYPGASKECPGLLQRHVDHLTLTSGLTLEIIRERGYESVVSASRLEELGFAKSQRRVPGLLLPVHCTDGSNGLYTYRPDTPRKDGRGRPRKYEMPLGSGARLDVPRRCQVMLRDPAIPLWITEGQKKGDALAAHGLCAVALLGVWMFKGKNEKGGITFLADWDYVALHSRTVNVCFDSDVMTKPAVMRAMATLTEHLNRNRATVRQVYLPDGPTGAKVGVDDYLLTHSVDELRALASAVPPKRELAVPTIELLDTAPAVLTRPLQLIDGTAFASTWLHVRRTIPETLDKQGRVVTHNPPIISTRQELFIVRGDGTIFGTGGEAIEQLGFDVRLGDPPPENRLMTALAVKKYHAGRRPDVPDVFGRVARVFDYYFDFSRSLGSQQQMCRLSSCMTMATYFTDAYTVQGYPWPNGEKGCGKTKWASLWASMGYLGMLVTAGGSFAALRDLAEYGAALAFDDAENLNDPKKTDPNKRALLLGGNRKGVQIPLKEQVGDKWQTRWVNVYAPRAFTAINAPDDVLYSRSIVIPLVRTGDGSRANRDPAKMNRWPTDARQLCDDLWSLALLLLPEAEQVWNELDEETEAVGRDLEPWRASLATARLMERHGVEGLEADIRAVMTNYFEERVDSVNGDRQRVVVLAIVRLIESRVMRACGCPNIADVSDLSVLRTLCCQGWTFTATDVQAYVKSLGNTESEEEDGTVDTEDIGWATPRAIGWQLNRLRLEVSRSPDKKRTKERRITIPQIQDLASAFSIETFLSGITPVCPGEKSASSTTSETSDVRCAVSQTALGNEDTSAQLSPTCHTCGLDVHRYDGNDLLLRRLNR